MGVVFVELARATSELGLSKGGKSFRLLEFMTEAEEKYKQRSKMRIKTGELVYGVQVSIPRNTQELDQASCPFEAPTSYCTSKTVHCSLTSEQKMKRECEATVGDGAVSEIGIWLVNFG